MSTSTFMAQSSAAEAEAKTISASEICKHNKLGDCWLVVRNTVYDLSTFDHPGGAAVILKYAGADATVAFDEIHAPGILDGLSPAQKLGHVSQNELALLVKPNSDSAKTSLEQASGYQKPPLSTLISLHDFEDVAREMYSAKTYAFYSSAATDLVAHQENLRCHKKLLLRPRVLRAVRHVATRRKVLGCNCSAPYFLSPAAMAKLAHPEGELAVARACGNANIVMTISSNASYPLADIIAAGRPNQPFFLQLYVNSDRSKTEELLRTAKKLGIKAIFVTVDAPVPGKREADERLAAGNVVAAISGAVATNDKKGGGLGRVMAKYIDANLTWGDLAWLREVSGLPLVLKGIQTAADAVMAAEHGVEGIMLSNHGGRSLDTTQPAMLTLLEFHRTCPWVFDKLEVYVDGGFSRGTDVLKAVALGAVAVGIGRPWLYALNYGQEGVEQMCDILQDELETSMKLSGIKDIDQAHPGMVNTSALEPFIRSTDDHPWIRWKPRARL